MVVDESFLCAGDDLSRFICQKQFGRDQWKGLCSEARKGPEASPLEWGPFITAVKIVAFLQGKKYCIRELGLGNTLRRPSKSQKVLGTFVTGRI